MKISLDITVGNEVQSGFDATKRYPPTLMTLTLLRLLIAILLAGYIGAEWVKNLHRGVV